MTPLVANVNSLLSILVVIGQVAVLIGVVTLLMGSSVKKWGQAVAKKAMLFSFLVAFTSTAGSLFYSDIAGFDPCKLCWFQRIFMYPMVLLLGMALWKKDKKIMDYCLGLSILGAPIAAYHYLLQLDVVPALPCSAVGYSAACSQTFVLTFGYITIPMMALTGFVMIIILCLIAKKYLPKK